MRGGRDDRINRKSDMHIPRMEVTRKINDLRRR